MPIVRPKNHTVIDMYKAWCLAKIEKDPTLSLVYDYNIKATGIKVLYRGRVKEPGRKGRILKEGKVVMSYTLFRMIVEVYNRMAIEEVIEGNDFELGSRLGIIRGKRKGRNFNKKVVDGVATRAARAIDPQHPLIYYTTEDYCLISWYKGHYVTNETIYNFKRSPGFKEKFNKALVKNPMLQYNFRFVPYTPSPNKTAS